MHIAMVGGLDRNQQHYRALAERAGFRYEHHTGQLAGRGSPTLEALVDRSELLIVVTDVNSHAAVWRVRQLARQRGKTCILMNRCGPSRFAGLLAELSQSETLPQQACGHWQAQR